MCAGRKIPSLSPLLLPACCQMGIMLFYIPSFKNHSIQTRCVSQRLTCAESCTTLSGGRVKSLFRLLLARCILSSFKSSSPPTSSLQKSSCHLLEESAIAAVPLHKGSTQSLESLLKSSPGLGVGGSSHKSCPGYGWISSPSAVYIRHWGCVFSLRLVFSLSCVCLARFREKQNMMLTAPQKVLNVGASP